MASAPQPQRKPTEVDSTPAGRHHRRRAQAVALIVVGGLVFVLSIGVFLSSTRGGDASPGGIPVEASPPDVEAPPSDEDTYFDMDPSAEPFDPPRAQNQRANGTRAVVTLADAESELTAMAEELSEQQAFSEEMVETLTDVADVVTDSLDEAINQGAIQSSLLLERADEVLDELLDEIGTSAGSLRSGSGDPSDVSTAATLVGAADDVWPAFSTSSPGTSEPTTASSLTPSVGLNDYIAMAGAIGGLLTAVAGVVTAIAEWRRTRRERVASGLTAARGGSSTPSDLDETIRPS